MVTSDKEESPINDEDLDELFSDEDENNNSIDDSIDDEDKDLDDLFSDKDENNENINYDNEIEIKEKVINRPKPEIIRPEEDQDDNLSESLKNLAKNFSATVDKVLIDADDDREMLNSIIIDLKGKVDELGISRGAASFNEQLVNAIGKKTDINIQKTKLLDSIAKLLASVKNNDALFGNSNSFNDIDFDDLLGDD